MNISFVKKCVWQVKGGAMRSFNKDSTYKVDDSFGKDIISAGYAVEAIESVKEKKKDASKSEPKKEKKSIKDYIKKVISAEENKEKESVSKKRNNSSK